MYILIFTIITHDAHYLDVDTLLYNRNKKISNGFIDFTYVFQIFFVFTSMYSIETRDVISHAMTVSRKTGQKKETLRYFLLIIILPSLILSKYDSLKSSIIIIPIQY
jgi:hypothetical protein